MAQQILIYIILVLFLGGTWAGCIYSREDENSVDDSMTEGSVISLNPHLSGLSLEDLVGTNQDGSTSMAEKQSELRKSKSANVTAQKIKKKDIDEMLEIPMKQQVNDFAGANVSGANVSGANVSGANVPAQKREHTGKDVYA
uniref:Secreted protein n=1 Tax=Globodera pallida TaxID=36090 RepID=A0A183CP79_GLOPA